LRAHGAQFTFHISKLGEYDIVIEFIGQRYVVEGIVFIISITSTVIHPDFGVKINLFIVSKLKLEQKGGTEE